MTTKSTLHTGYDIGGTKTEIVLLSQDEKILFQLREPTERDRGYDHILSVLKKLFDACIDDQKITPKDITSIGLALPGTVCPVSQKMLVGNTRVLEGKDIKSDFLKILNIDIPIRAENDANCFALAECHYGVGRSIKSQNMVGIILGTGVGSGIILNGKIYSGKRGAAGEAGHTFLKKGEKLCYCGQFDCAELYLSGPGYQNFYFEKTGEEASTSIIFKKKDFLEIYKQDLALFLARLTNILDPDYFVLGGGVSKADELYSDLENLMKPHLFHKEDPPRILKHRLSDSAGSIGAALLSEFST
ncbi:MAG: ROK family protein [Bdellovibrionota bacterium]